MSSNSVMELEVKTGLFHTFNVFGIALNFHIPLSNNGIRHKKNNSHS